MPLPPILPLFYKRGIPRTQWACCSARLVLFLECSVWAGAQTPQPELSYVAGNLQFTTRSAKAVHVSSSTSGAIPPSRAGEDDPSTAAKLSGIAAARRLRACRSQGQGTVQPSGCPRSRAVDPTGAPRTSSDRAAVLPLAFAFPRLVLPLGAATGER